MRVEQKTVEMAKTLQSQLVYWRRHFHQYPELSFQEYATTTYIAEQLSKMDGIQVKTTASKPGVVGTIQAGDGPTIAIRADIDALPIEEANDHGFASKHQGVMHACGHDAHTAILLGVAKLLSHAFQKGELKGTVKLIFQPAEEATDESGFSGARYMIADGVYDDVDLAIALHMCPWLPVGQIQMNDFHSMANVDVFKVEIFGTGGHGAYPHLGTDPVWMLGPVMQALHGIVARKVSPLDMAVVSVGQIHAGSASNIIPTKVTIEGTIRSYKPEVRDFLIQEVEKACSVVDKLDGSYTFNVEKGEPALNNHPQVNQMLAKTVDDLFPGYAIQKSPFGMGGEDFGWVSEIVPASMFFLGSSLADGKNRDLHTPIFDIDERCLSVGVAMMTETAIRFLNGKYRLGGVTHVT